MWLTGEPEVTSRDDHKRKEKKEMKRRLLIGLSAILLGASVLQSQAALTIGQWETAGNQSQTTDGGNTVWTLVSTDLPDNLIVDFVSITDMRIQGAGGVYLSGASYTLHYTVKLNNGMKFENVYVDSTRVGEGSTTVTKTITDPNNAGFTPVIASSVNGAPSAITDIPGLLGEIDVFETINVTGGTLRDFANTYNVVPEPSAMIAGALLLLPFGASIIRSVRRNKA